MLAFKYVALALVAAVIPLQGASRLITVEGRQVLVEFDQQLHSRVVAKLGGKVVPLGPFAASESILVGGASIGDFTLTRREQRSVRDKLGAGRRSILSGTAQGLRKTVTATVYDEFPGMVFFEVEYTNTGSAPLSVEGWVNNRYALEPGPSQGEVPFWSYQSGSYSKRPDWVLPLKAGFQQENYMGMNATDYGGGTPVVDVWRPDVGLGVGHIETAPKLVSLPVAVSPERQATLSVTYRAKTTLNPGASLKTFRTFVAVHQGDYFRTLTEYRRVMAKQGFTFRPAPDSAFEPIWCGWGYGRQFTPAQIYGALPIVKKLGFRWVTLDDGWQTALGDWFLVKEKFPEGDQSMKAMVDTFHREGFRAQLWWAPLAAHAESELVKQHPDMLLLNADGSRQRITYWNAWYLCPADPRVVEYHRKLVVKMLGEWGYEGLKLDGQHMNGAPPCYNPAHKHARPEDSVEAMPQFFKAIFEAALAVKPDALVEFCPCGTAFSFFTLPYMNMSVASDPRGSWQVRTKGKTLKALHGDDIAYFGDHVELSDKGEDFASTVGVGGVIGTNFRWPPGSGGQRKGRGDLTPERELIFEKWIKIYKEKMLSRGEYLGGLYDIGFDRPEAHAIRKGRAMYYAFFAPTYKGEVELRGLARGKYRVTDYENGKDLGTVTGPVARLPVEFTAHLMLEARPE